MKYNLCHHLVLKNVTSIFIIFIFEFYIHCHIQSDLIIDSIFLLTNLIKFFIFEFYSVQKPHFKIIQIFELLKNSVQ